MQCQHFSETRPMALSERLHCGPHDELLDINIGRLLDSERDCACNGIGFDCGIGERFERLSRAGIADVSDQFALDRARADNGAANIRPSLLPKAFRDGANGEFRAAVNRTARKHNMTGH